MIDKKEKLKTEWVNNIALDILNNLNSWICLRLTFFQLWAITPDVLFLFVCLFVYFCFCFCFFVFYSGSLKSELIRVFQINFCSLLFIWNNGSTRSLWLVTCTVCCACSTTNEICNPWTASKSDRATKIIVTLLFKDGFQKCKNYVEADKILFEK